MMKTALAMAVAMAMFLVVGCGNTATDYNSDTNWGSKDDMFAADDTFYADSIVGQDESAPPFKEVEEWALECGLLWPVDAWFICNFVGIDEPIGPCQLEWDHESCKASCFTSTHGFDNATVEKISTECEQTEGDGWATGCDPPIQDGTIITCTIPEEEYFIDFCELLWNKSECTASCWASDTQTFPFQGASAEAVSTYCHPVY